jgi:hypothetical protein
MILEEKSTKLKKAMVQVEHYDELMEKCEFKND